VFSIAGALIITLGMILMGFPTPTPPVPPPPPLALELMNQFSTRKITVVTATAADQKAVTAAITDKKIDTTKLIPYAQQTMGITNTKIQPQVTLVAVSLTNGQTGQKVVHQPAYVFDFSDPSLVVPIQGAYYQRVVLLLDAISFSPIVAMGVTIATASPPPAPSPSPSVGPSPSPSVGPSPSPSPSPSVSPGPSASPAPGSSPKPSPKPTVKPSPKPTVKPSPTPAPSLPSGGR